ncbi:MAG: hypothetical protein F4X18_01050 [Acidimicrobiia bacterium]|nr:hypothetical protein [Acidimicrobiia bacterium]
MSDISIQMEFVSTMIAPLLIAAQENGKHLSMDDVPPSVLQAAREITEHEGRERPRILLAS